MAELPAIVFSDFDGTITLSDSNDHLTDTIGFGQQKRKHLNKEVLNGTMTFRETFHDMMKSVTTPFPECIEILRKNIKLDPGFKEFFTWCLSRNIPVIVVSSGMRPVISALLKDLVGSEADKIEIISNDVHIDHDGTWNVVFRDDSDFGHDKSICIKPYATKPQGQRPHLFYCGDGVSDLSAARETDLLFAKEGMDLITYCQKEKIPYTEFKNFKQIHKIVEDIVDKKTTIEEINKVGEPVKDSKKETVK